MKNHIITIAVAICASTAFGAEPPIKVAKTPDLSKISQSAWTKMHSELNVIHQESDAKAAWEEYKIAANDFIKAAATHKKSPSKESEAAKIKAEAAWNTAWKKKNAVFKSAMIRRNPELKNEISMMFDAADNNSSELKQILHKIDPKLPTERLTK